MAQVGADNEEGFGPAPDGVERRLHVGRLYIACHDGHEGEVAEGCLKEREMGFEAVLLRVRRVEHVHGGKVEQGGHGLCIDCDAAEGRHEVGGGGQGHAGEADVVGGPEEDDAADGVAHQLELCKRGACDGAGVDIAGVGRDEGLGSGVNEGGGVEESAYHLDERLTVLRVEQACHRRGSYDGSVEHGVNVDGIVHRWRLVAMTIAGGHPTRFWSALPDGRVQCEVCPRHCRLTAGQRGACFVRMGTPEGVMLATYGRSSGFCVDPIEKKPLNHFLPGSAVLSFGTAGCNLACAFCQNWSITRSREVETLNEEASPEAIARCAVRLGCASVAYTYNDPVVFLEYAVDTAVACRAVGVRNVAVTAGYLCDEPRRELFGAMDAANVDLKAFTDRFYRTLCGARLEPVKETLVYLRKHTRVWLELTTLLIPGENDSEQEVGALADWVVSALGPDVPLHFTAFHPDHKMLHLSPTPTATLRTARAIAKRAGVRHVYTGNVRDPEGATTWCAGCGAALIEREGYAITGWHLDGGGACENCGTLLAGVFDARPGGWNGGRLPVAIT